MKIGIFGKPLYKMLSSALRSLTGGGTPTVDPIERTPINKTQAYDMADARDILSMFVGAGRTSMKDNDMNNAFARLKQVVGAPLAQKLTTQAILFNQRPEVQKLSPEQRVHNFFTLGSNDAEVSDYIKKVGGMGTGPVDAFRNSAMLNNSNLQGKYVSTDPGNAETARMLQSLIGRKGK